MVRIWNNTSYYALLGITHLRNIENKIKTCVTKFGPHCHPYIQLSYFAFLWMLVQEHSLTLVSMHGKMWESHFPSILLLGSNICNLRGNLSFRWIFWVLFLTKIAFLNKITFLTRFKGNVALFPTLLLKRL